MIFSPRALLSLVVSTLFAAPSSAQVTPQAEAYYQYSLARSYEQQNQVQKALEAYRKAGEADPKSGEIQLALAAVYLRTNRVTEAIAAGRRAVEVEPALSAAHRFLGKVYSQMMAADAKDGLAELALGELREAVRLAPDDVESLLILAQFHLRRGEAVEASERLEALLRYAPDSYYALFLLGELRHAEGKLEEATDLLRAAVAAEPRFDRGYASLAALYEEQGEFGRAVQVYRQALEVSPASSRLPLASALARSGALSEAAAEFENVIGSEPGNPQALLGLASVRRELLELDVAESLLKKVLAAEPHDFAARFALVGVYEDRRQLGTARAELQAILKDIEAAKDLEPDARRERRLKCLVRLGLVHEQLEDVPAAIEALEKASDEAGGRAPFDSLLVEAYLAGGRLEDASRAIEKSLTRSRDSREMLLLKAQLLQKQEKDGEALALIGRLREAAPQDLELLSGLAGLYRRARRLSEAEDTLKQALEIAPENEALLFQLGAVLERQKKFEDAEAAFKKVLTVNPKSSMTLNYLGYMLADRGVRLEESLNYLKSAVALDPFNGSYLDSLGWAYFKLGELDRAEEHLLKAIQSLRETAVVYDHLGDLYHRRGRLEDALRYWQKALDRDDEDLEKQEVARKIEQVRPPSKPR